MDRQQTEQWISRRMEQTVRQQTSRQTEQTVRQQTSRRMEQTVRQQTSRRMEQMDRQQTRTQSLKQKKRKMFLIWNISSRNTMISLNNMQKKSLFPEIWWELWLLWSQYLSLLLSIFYWEDVRVTTGMRKRMTGTGSPKNRERIRTQKMILIWKKMII